MQIILNYVQRCPQPSTVRLQHGVGGELDQYWLGVMYNLQAEMHIILGLPLADLESESDNKMVREIFRYFVATRYAERKTGCPQNITRSRDMDETLRYHLCRQRKKKSCSDRNKNNVEIIE